MPDKNLLDVSSTLAPGQSGLISVITPVADSLIRSAISFSAGTEVS